MVGYNIAALALDLHEQKYAIDIARVDGHFDQIDKWTDNLSDITRLLAEVNNAKKKHDPIIDLSQTVNEETGTLLVDDVRAISAHLIPQGVYTWKADEIELLIDTLNGHSKQIATQINPRTMRANQGLQDIGELVKVFHEIIKQSREETQHSIKNQTH
jgi:hypothetical protein